MLLSARMSGCFGVERGDDGVEVSAHDLLGNVAVDQASAQGVSPLVRSNSHLMAVFVADVACMQPAAQRFSVCRDCQRELTVEVLGGAREQRGGAGGPAR